MSHSTVRLLATCLLILGVGVAGYILFQIPPYQSSGTLDFFAVGLFFFGLLLGLTGACSLITLTLHQRWPALAGVYQTPTRPLLQPNPNISLRQGFLASLSLCAILLFSMLQILDSIFVFVVFLLAGLIETYFQVCGGKVNSKRAKSQNRIVQSLYSTIASYSLYYKRLIIDYVNFTS